MSDFFTKKDNSVNEGSNDAHTNANNEVAEQKEFEKQLEKQPTTDQYKGNFDSLLEHFSNDIQEVPDNPNHRKKEPENKAENPANPETPNDENSDEKAENVNKQSPEFYEQQGKFIADMTDIVVPKGITFLNGQKGNNSKGIPYENEYKAESQLKKEIGMAWARVLEEKAIKFTPMQQLIWVNVMAYGMPLSLSVWNFIQKTIAKREETNLAMMQTLERMNSNIAGSESVPNQPPPPQKQPPPTQKPPPEPPAPKQNVEPVKPFFENKSKIDSHFEITEVQEVENEPIILGLDMKVCIHPECEKSFEVGKGFGKTKNSQSFDTYCSNMCMRNVINTKNQANRVKKK